MADLESMVKESFARYAGNVILDRAICDVRDMLKPSARMLMYSQLHITKNTNNKPFVKSARVVGDCLGHYYTHGDGSCYSTYMRMAKPFAMRYPLEQCQGNSGTITETGDEASMRYTELRLSKLGDQLFSGIEKETIKDWYDNFDETETYPKILPSKGFYNIVNGTTGIGVSLSSSIPQFNINDINNAIINLMDNSDYEVDILPDFATGGVLINPQEVKEALKVGHGCACKLRSVVEFNSAERAFVVTEIPYGVYTNTISEQIAKLVESNPDCGIDHINDGSGKTPDYMIYLTKQANPDKVLSLLYKETALQSYFTINMNVLVDNGKRPATLGLKEMLLAYIAHEQEVYRRGFEFDLHKAQERQHIIDGLLICLAYIEEVISTIKNAASPSAASALLQSKFILDEVQAKAVLDMKLARLSHLEVDKLRQEHQNLQIEIERIEAILSNQVLLNEEIKKDLVTIMNKIGDGRRTKIMQLESNEDEIIEEKEVVVNYTNMGNVYTTETSSLYTGRRRTVGTKFKLDKDEFIYDTLVCKNTNKIIFFSENGKYTIVSANTFPIEQKSILPDCKGEHIVAATVINEKSDIDLIFVTQLGNMKRTPLSEYTSRSSIAINLKENEKIVSVVPAYGDKIMVLTKSGMYLKLKVSDITKASRKSGGVRGIKLDSTDVVVSAHMVDNAPYIIPITVEGKAKRVSNCLIGTGNRGNKGTRIGTEKEYVDFTVANENSDVLITTTVSQLRIEAFNLSVLSRNAAGTSSIKLPAGAKVVKISSI